jgi:hypothetical protein
MTPDDLAAIRERDAEVILYRRDVPDYVNLVLSQAALDRAVLLAEVDRLEAALFVSEERVALIREAVVELEGEYAGKILYPTLIRRSKVLDIIEGVTP